MWSFGPLVKELSLDYHNRDLCIYIYSHPGVDRIWFLKGIFFSKYRDV